MINHTLADFLFTRDDLSRGEKYVQLHHVYPQLSPLYTDFEKLYNPHVVLDTMKANDYILPVASVVIYALFCIIGTLIMRNFKPFKLESTLALWNLLLSVFSAYGSIRTVPWLIYRVSTASFEDTVCEPAYLTFGSGATGLATQLFILSKIPELIDTVFIVLRKKPLIFLHWYHHITVLLYCWNSYVTESAAGLYFVAMNYTVHAVMYFYYFLMAAKMLPKSFPSWIITVMQISQMIVGTIVVGSCLYFYKFGGKKYAPGECNNEESNLIAGFVMYGSYLYLFVEFAVKRFIFGIKEEKKVKKA